MQILLPLLLLNAVIFTGPIKTYFYHSDFVRPIKYWKILVIEKENRNESHKVLQTSLLGVLTQLIEVQ